MGEVVFELPEIFWRKGSEIKTEECQIGSPNDVAGNALFLYFLPLLWPKEPHSTALEKRRLKR